MTQRSTAVIPAVRFRKLNMMRATTQQKKAVSSEAIARKTASGSAGIPNPVRRQPGSGTQSSAAPRSDVRWGGDAKISSPPFIFPNVIINAKDG